MQFLQHSDTVPDTHNYLQQCVARAFDFHYDTNPIRKPKTENQRIVLNLHTVADTSVRNCQEPYPSVGSVD